MAITFVGAERTVQDSSTDVTTSKPAGAAENDIAFCILTSDDTETLTLPSGFTELYNGPVPSDAVGATSLAIGYRVLGSSEPSSYTGTISSINGSTMIIAVWSGIDPANPLDVAFDFDTLSASVAMPPCPSVTTVTDDAAVITIVATARGTSFSDMDWDAYYTPPASITEALQANYGAGTDYTGSAIGWDTQATAGATGTRQWTHIDDDDGGFAGTAALRPASTAKTVNVGHASEADQALPATPRRILTVGRATEVSTAGQVSPSLVTVVVVGRATETDTATLVQSPKAARVGRAVETSTATPVGRPLSRVVAQATETEHARAVTPSRTVQLGRAVETSAAYMADPRRVRLIAVGKAAGTETARPLRVAKRIIVGKAWVHTRAGRLMSGLSPFWWTPHQVANGVPSKRRLRPIVFTDKADGQHYIIMRNEADNLIRLEPFTPRPWDEVYSPAGGPTLDLDGRIYRLYVVDGVLRYERSLYDVRTRPILFGKVARPRPQEPRYELTLAVHE